MASEPEDLNKASICSEPLALSNPWAASAPEELISTEICSEPEQENKP